MAAGEWHESAKGRSVNPNQGMPMRIFTSLVAAAITTACSLSALAQGTIIFNNNTGLVNYWGDNPVPTKGGGFVQLFWAPAGTLYTPWTLSLTPSAWYAANPGWSLGPVVGFSTPVAGKFNGGTMTLSPLAPGGTIDYVIAGWVGSYSTMDTAYAANSPVGVSTKFTTKTGDPTTNPAGSPVPLADTFGGMTIIPEPSSLALAGVALATLFTLRRRDQSLITRL